MRFSIRLNEDEEKELALIQERLQCNTKSQTIKQMIKLWIKASDESIAFQNSFLKSSARCNKLDSTLFKISSALEIALSYKSDRLVDID